MATFVRYASYDGWIRQLSNVDWATVHDATDGFNRGTSDAEVIVTAEKPGEYWVIRRAFFVFDTSGIRNITSATLHIYGYSEALSDIAILKGTQPDSGLALSDFDSFEGPLLAHFGGWVIDAYNSVAVPIGSIVAGNTKYCLLEYTRDHLNVDPDPNTYRNGLNFVEAPGTSKDPYLEIVGDLVPDYIPQVMWFIHG